MKVLKGVYGIALCVMIATVASLLCKISIGGFSLNIIGAPVIAILMGMIVTKVFPKMLGNECISTGVKFTSKKVLQWAVIILGFSLNLGTVLKVGGKSLPVIISTISISLIVSFFMMKVLKINSTTACLIGVGSSICGGSAIAATAPVIDADDEQVAQAISVIFLYNILAALIFPVFGYRMGLSADGFAIFAGTAVNDTSSVTAAAATAENIYNVSGILSNAVIVKLTRTLAIIPITIALAFYKTKKAKNSEQGGNVSIMKIFPWFIVYFVLASLITTVVGIMPEGAFSMAYEQSFIPIAKLLAKFFIAMAMGAIGLNTDIVKLIKNGGKPIILGFCCWVAITAVSLLVQSLIGIF